MLGFIYLSWLGGEEKGMAAASLGMNGWCSPNGEQVAAYRKGWLHAPSKCLRNVGELSVDLYGQEVLDSQINFLAKIDLV